MIHEAANTPTYSDDEAPTKIRGSHHPLATHPLSANYSLLINLVRNFRLICLLSYNSCRDVAQASFRETPDGPIFEVSARGTTYITAYNEDCFTKECEKWELEFIPPSLR